MDRTPASLLDRMTGSPDTAAWERFVRLFTPLMDRWARRLSVPETDAADLIQDVFVVLVRRLPHFRYDPSKSFRAWLWTVFRHSVLAWREGRSRQLHLVDQFDELPSTASDPTEAEYRSYLIGRALAVLKADFPTQTWKMFWEVAVDGRRGVDVAAQFGTTPNAVYLARVRVLSRLRQELAGLDH